MLRQDLDSLTPTRDFTRRAFVQTSASSGCAATVLPVFAPTLVKTGTEELKAGTVTIPVRGFNMPAYRAVPSRETSPA